ncbi:MAG: hypothetical protein N3E51_03400 [Candidatus Micrarchaeota archaeon]|nr:hypothetical protein [Candidatus Micrarchaeota archaeon]
MGLLYGFFSWLRRFLEDDFNKAALAAVLLLGALAFVIEPAAAALPTKSEGKQTFYHFFYLSSCPHCKEQMNSLHPQLEKEFNLTIAYHEIAAPTEKELFERLRRERGFPGGVPTTLVGGEAFFGYNKQIGGQIRAAVAKCVQEGCESPLGLAGKKESPAETFELPLLGQVDAKTASLPALAVVLGLIDGFNPCAMWVLVYLISLAMVMNDRRRVLLIAGCFVFASGVLYFLFMSAWLNAFLFVGYLRAITVAVGMVAMLAGILNLREYWKAKRGGGVECKVGDAKMHASMAAQAREIAAAPMSLALFFAIIALAFVVNSVEFVCSSAIPAVFTQILALRQLPPLDYYAYILLYDVFFMLDDMIILGLAALTISESVGHGYAELSKLAGGALMLVLGLLLLFAPKLLW